MEVASTPRRRTHGVYIVLAVDLCRTSPHTWVPAAHAAQQLTCRREDRSLVEAHHPPLPSHPPRRLRRARAASAPYNTIWEFGYMINGQACDMAFTSVAGHLMELVFSAPFKKWRG